MKIELKKSLSFALFLLTCFLSTANAQKTVSVFERVAQSLSEKEPNWKLIKNDDYYPLHGNGFSSAQAANLSWSNGTTVIHATVILYRKLKAAKKAFSPRDKGHPNESLRIAGIGDKAYLWPPKVRGGTAHNLRFRKGRMEVWLTGFSEEVVKRCGQIVASSIPSSID